MLLEIKTQTTAGSDETATKLLTVNIYDPLNTQLDTLQQTFGIDFQQFKFVTPLSDTITLQLDIGKPLVSQISCVISVVQLYVVQQLELFNKFSPPYSSKAMKKALEIRNIPNKKILPATLLTSRNGQSDLK